MQNGWDMVFPLLQSWCLLCSYGCSVTLLGGGRYNITFLYMSITSIYSHICHENKRYDYFIHRKVRLTIAIKHSKIRLKSSRLSHHNTHELNSWTFHRIICIAHTALRKNSFMTKYLHASHFCYFMVLDLWFLVLKRRRMWKVMRNSKPLSEDNIKP